MVSYNPLEQLRESILAPKYGLVCESRQDHKFYYADRKQIVSNLNDYEQVQLNYPFRINGFPLDVDNSEFELDGNITPSWQSFNTDNDKHHTVFMLDRPINMNSPAIEYDAIRIYKKLKAYTKSDFNYNGILTKNPFNPKFRTRVIGGSIKDIYKDLAFLKDYEVPTRSKAAEPNLFNHYFTGQSLNGQFFYRYAQDFSHAHKRFIFSDLVKYFEVMDECIDPINRIIVDQHGLPPISSDGAEQIITSITSYVGKYAQVWRDRYTARQRYRASIKANSIKEATRKEIERAFEYCATHTIKPTKTKIAALAGLSRQQLHATYKDDYAYNLEVLHAGFY